MVDSSTKVIPSEFSNLTDILRYRAVHQPEKISYIFLKNGETEEARLTYEELERKVRSIAALLQSSGVAAGERALLLYPPGLDYVAAFFGCLYAGVIAVPVYPPHPAKPERTMPRLRGIVKSARPYVSLTTTPILGMIESSFSQDPDFGKMRWLATDNITHDLASDWQEPKLSSDTLAFLQYTSGSTGNPKGVMVSHGNLMHNERMLQEAFKLTEDSTIVVWLPLYHDMGLIGNVLYALYIGTPCVLMSPAAFLQKPFRWLQAISRYNAAFSGGPNFAYDLCTRKITPEQRKNLDLSCWESAFNGAEPVRADTLERFSAAFESCGFQRETAYPCYGLAETTLIVSGGRKQDPPIFGTFDKEALKQRQVAISSEGDYTLVGCGNTLYDQHIVIVNPDTLEPCQPNEIGEIWVSGKNVARGYWEKPKETKQTFRAYFSDTGKGPFLRTGDLGFFSHGALFIAGRLKDVIIVRGRNYYPQDIELTAERSYPRLRPGCSAAFQVEADGKEHLVIVAEVERRFKERRRRSGKKEYNGEERRGSSRRKLTVLPEHIPDDRTSLDAESAFGAIRRAVAKEHELEVYGIALLKVGSVPKTSSGKIRRHACKTKFLDQTLNMVAKDILKDTEPSDIKAFPDRERLLNMPPEEQQAITESYLQDMVSVIFKDVLGGKTAGIHDNLFDIGGHSLLIIRLQNKLQEVFNNDIPIANFFRYPTIADMAQYLTRKSDPETSSDIRHICDRVRMWRTAEKERFPIAIIGMAGRFPGAETLDEFWENLRDGKESVSFFTDEELTASGADPMLLHTPGYVRAGAVMKDIEMFDASFFGFSPKEARLTDPQHRLFLECAWETLENAGYDTETYDGRIGVYAGAAMNTYLFKNLMQNSDLIKSADDFQLVIGNDKDYLSTRVSYKLNLKGPSVNVATACSTSLVAVSLACQSLWNHQCDMALAGGVSVRVEQEKGYIYHEGGIPSPDGHCRAFDADAKGTVLNASGMGSVLLKRLEDALADGDCIHAVIRGTAVNNDGSLKVGYTAPGAEGQAEVITEAQAMAGTDPETITYIETHGTGTVLGDPVEIMALTQAFRSMSESKQTPFKKGFCAIGSVKTNIGHLDAASGAAGLIKTVLAMKHRMIPPSLNFERPNPEIDFTNSPFHVSTKLSEWKTAEGIPRRAGVSSFGIGGTNAHVVVEEAPLTGISGTFRPWSLLVLSAKTPSALDTATENLVRHLKAHPDLHLADVAYTLQVGRKAFSHRRMLVCQDTNDALAPLDTKDPKRVFTNFREPADRPVAFMFSGQGAQYENMGLELYRTEQTFRDQVDLCSELLRPYLGSDIRQILYPSVVSGQLQDTADNEQRTIDQTAIAQPALFVAEYALARLWMEWGVHPRAMIGHSIGEYVAACLAGVFSLEDALSLVAARAQMMQELPRGGMIAVPLSEQDVLPLLLPSLSLAAVNGPCQCVISGPAEKMEILQHRLGEQGTEYRRLHTSHAFHSDMTEAIMKPFAEQVRKVRLTPPKTPYISNVTGTWITPSEATDPDYWARHLRQTVRFSEGLRLLMKNPQQILLEIGPGRTLTTFAMQHPDRSPEQVMLTSVRHPQDNQSDSAFLLTTLGKLWLSGANIRWSGVQSREKRHRLPLPTYPFERQRYWIEPGNRESRAHQDQVSAFKSQLSKKPDIADWFYVPSWKRVPLAIGQPLAVRQEPTDNWLIFVDECGLGEQLAKQLKADGQKVIIVKNGPSFAKQEIPECQSCTLAYTLNPEQQEGYDALFNELRTYDSIPRHIAHLWNVSDKFINYQESEIKNFKSQMQWVDNAQYLGFYSLLFLAQAIGRQNITDTLQIAVISNNMQEVNPGDLRCPEKATSMGLVRVIPQEYPNISCRNIDVVISDAEAEKHRLAGHLLAELATTSPDPVVAYRGDYRWVQTFEPVRLEPRAQGTAPLREKGVYMITGGLGGVGSELAEYLARTVHAKLVLVGRTELPPREEWDEWLSATYDEPQNGPETDIEKEADFILQREDALRHALGIREISSYDGLEKTLDELCASYIYDYFSSSHTDMKKGQAYLAEELRDKLKVLPKFNKFYDFFIRVLARDAIIRVKDQNIIFLKTREEIRDPEVLKKEAEARYPEFKGMFSLLDHCVRHYPQALSGETEAISVLFPGGNSELVEDFVKAEAENGTSRLCKTLLQEIISKILTRTPGRSIRLLEIGAGTGELTKVIAPALINQNVEYYFTDIGKSFVIKAQKDAEANGFNFMKFGVLDISQDPVRQGYDAHSFDMIFGLNVVHATKHIRETTTHLRNLLIPGGILALIETVKPRPVIDMVWGLAEGWWYFEDEDIRKKSPLLTPEKWEELLQKEGFRHVKAYPQDKEKRRSADFGLILAQERTDIAGYSGPGRVSKDQSIQNKIKRLIKSEAAGGEVLTIQADVSDIEQMQSAITKAYEHFGRIDGVIHGAGIEGGGAIQLKTCEAATNEFDSKIKGTLVLHSLFQDVPSDFFLLCSSLTSVAGGFGQVGYCGANAFLDNFAHLDLSHKTVSVNWDRWQNLGMATDVELRHHLISGEELPEGMNAEEGMEAFSRILFRGDLPQILVSPRDLMTSLTMQDNAFVSGSAEKAVRSGQFRQSHPRPPLNTPYAPPVNDIHEDLVRIWQEVLGISRIGIHDDFFELGGDSLIGTQIISRLREAFDLELSPGTLFENPTIASLATLIKMTRVLEEPFVGSDAYDKERGIIYDIA
ncbi:type I polyketide synthase [Desulfonema magnum]|uniref:Phenolphthiocerol/phthiocerol polyketide synthase subunit E n=1 Tax=Desulfonema magnum TaxID=45655 RepID=A0A975BTL1_9BACT|nr:type I polyketide synthase [Desulfonema magnum]QTA91519.1 AMP-binding and acyl and methytramsferase domains-containing protein [Desulfonema magnum]